MDGILPIDQFPPFFEGARLNFAENLLCGDDEEVAVISLDEVNLLSPQKHTWKELRLLVGRYASALRSSGLKREEVVACM